MFLSLRKESRVSMSRHVDKKNDFSVALGLTDYGNPILYTITCTTIIANMDKVISSPWDAVYILGVILSLAFGFAIPTVKLLIGLGRMKFKLPVGFVFCVNAGIFISGLMLIKSTISTGAFLGIILLSIAILALIYSQSRRFNNVAVLIGAIGYLLIYLALIARSVSNGLIVPVVLYVLAICLYVRLIGIGIKANLKDARVHWVIELSNILCQAFVAAGTLLLFANIP